MRRGEIWRCDAHLAERGNKPGYYIIVSRPYIAETPQIATVVVVPIYSEILGLATEVQVGLENGLPRISAARGDFITSVFKSMLSRRMGQLSDTQIGALDEALHIALDLP